MATYSEDVSNTPLTNTSTYPGLYSKLNVVCPAVAGKSYDVLTTDRSSLVRVFQVRPIPVDTRYWPSAPVDPPTLILSSEDIPTTDRVARSSL